MLERYEGKLSRTVLRREGGRNLSFLFDILFRKALSTEVDVKLDAQLDSERSSK